MSLPRDFSLSALKSKLLAWLKKKKPRLYPLLGFWILLLFLFLGSKIIKTKSTAFPFTTLGRFAGFKQLLPSPAPYPVNQNLYPVPELSAKSVLVLDVDSMVALYEKEADLKLLPASTTKIMTALITLENYNLDQIITVGESKIDGNSVGLKPGEEITVKNLLYALLIQSGNDAAMVLAENYPGGAPAFIAAMNKRAQELNLENTHFTNPIGLDEEGHYSSARDLARLSIFAIGNPLLAEIVSTPAMTIPDVSGKITHSLKNTNELVGQLEGVKGIKTGWTEKAGECLISFTERNGRKVVTVILGSRDRFGETRALIDWVFKNFSWQLIVPPKYR